MESADSAKAAKILQSLADAKESDERHDGVNANEEPDPSSVQDLMNKGSIAFAKREFTDAVQIFKRALDIQISHYGRLAPECIEAYYKYALALLNEFPVPPEGDPMAGVPKEADYQPRLNTDGTLAPAIRDGNLPYSADNLEVVDRGDGTRNAISALKVLEVAWSIIESQQGDTMEKVDILCAMGEAEFLKVEFRSSWEHYQNALDILENLVDPDSQRIAHLRFKTCLCFEQYPLMLILAMNSCNMAIKICQARLGRLTSKVEVSCVTDGNHLNQGVSSEDPTASEKLSEIKGITRLLDIFNEKLKVLVKRVDSALNSSDVSVESLRSSGSSDDRISSRESIQMSNTIHPKVPSSESPTTSTACTTKIGMGTKRKLAKDDDGAENTSIKRPSKDS